MQTHLTFKTSSELAYNVEKTRFFQIMLAIMVVMEKQKEKENLKIIEIKLKLQTNSKLIKEYYNLQ